MTENNVSDYEKNQQECERLETQLKQLREKNATPDMMKTTNRATRKESSHTDYRNQYSRRNYAQTSRDCA